MKPDLSTPEGRAAWRRELRGVALPWRVAGMAMVVIGAIGLFWFGRGPERATDSDGGLVSLALIGAGWVVLVAAIVKRSLYNKARMSDDG
jgi:hypothetical protein